ncbi:hypothetical protein PENSPDRAFT_695411 [Peniophora sp. CONT]|nr:hypothetical protein PENSPDRAFT_695411 [Peniophora sp. CONT]
MSEGVCAAERTSTAFSDIQRLLERLTVYIERIQVRLKVPLGREAREIALRGLVEMLNLLALATKMLQQHQSFLKALFIKGDDVQASIQRMRDITSDEERMTITEALVSIHELSSHVSEAEERISQRVDATIRDVHSDMPHVSRFGYEERDIVCRALAMISAYAIGSVCDHELYAPSSPLEVVSMACTFLLALILWKLNAITRPLGQPPGIITIIDVFGVAFTLQDGTFSSWEAGIIRQVAQEVEVGELV